jgi:uncharacterized protein
MGKLLIWVAIGVAAWLAWRFLVVGQRRSGGAPPDDTPPAGGGSDRGVAPAEAPGTPELMMQCAVCGIHLPGSEARFKGGRVYCGDAHRDQGVAEVREAAGRGRDDA